MSYPVLFTPDGGLEEDFIHVAEAIHFGAMWELTRPMFVVGIENTDRRRDLTGPTEIAAEKEAARRAGGAGKFREFLRDELIPEISARYRTSGERAIVGESLAGLFVVETFLEEPQLFDTYILKVAEPGSTAGRRQFGTVRSSSPAAAFGAHRRKSEAHARARRLLAACACRA